MNIVTKHELRRLTGKDPCPPEEHCWRCDRDLRILARQEGLSRRRPPMKVAA